MTKGLENILEGATGCLKVSSNGSKDSMTRFRRFYYARSSRDADAFTTDIESTAQALGIIERGLQQRLTDDIKADLVRFSSPSKTLGRVFL